MVEWNLALALLRRSSARACETVRQRGLTSSLWEANWEKKCPGFSYTAALVPKHKLAVTSSRAPQIDSATLKSGLYPGRLINRRRMQVGTQGVTMMGRSDA